MFQNQPDIYSDRIREFTTLSGYSARLNQSLSLFNKVRSEAFMEKLKSFVFRTPNNLMDLQQVPMKYFRSQHYGGIQPVMIDQICGTSGRVGDFDRHMNPLSDRIRDRWISIAQARFSFNSLPAVELIQIGCCYYIKDGHHRISVARAMGEFAIDAEVTIWEMNEAFYQENKPVTQIATQAF